MDIGRQILAKMRKKRKSDHTGPSSPKGLEVHFYTQATQPLVKSKGCYTVEDLCTECAKLFGISPLCHSLYALYDEERAIWYPPNHSFKADGACIKLYYRMRFYFTNWHGTQKIKKPMIRHTLKRVGPEGTSILDETSLAYLFAQGQYDFVHGLAPVRLAQDEGESHDIENECLGMAVLSISHDSADKEHLDSGSTVRKISYKRHIPESLKQSIYQRNFLVRLRIANVFKRFLNEFNQKTVMERSVSPLDLKLKYIATLETLTDGFGCEIFEPASLRTLDADGLDQSPVPKQPACHQVLVSGTAGIQWRLKPSERELPPKEKASSKKTKRDSCLKKDKTKDCQDWITFSDFYEITHIIVKESLVTIHKRDNTQMELDLEKQEKAFSFITLVDGYFRLTADAHHFLCREVAPPSVKLNILEGCHGPISTDYAIHKLCEEGNDEGLYLLRRSSTDYEHILLTVVCNEMNSVKTKSYKHFQIVKEGDGYLLCGTEVSQPGLRELMELLEGQQLRSDNTTLQLTRGFPPQPKEISNLLVATREEIQNLPPTHLVFHRILKEDVVEGEHLGRGTRTNIYAGKLRLRDEADYLDFANDHQEVKVVLKVLSAGQRDMSDFLETVSVMRLVSHKHMSLLYGICVRNQDIIMVEERLQHGPLDLFMQAHGSSLSPTWKFQVAKQLASVLSYLEDKRLVHGFVCAKNILLARDGLDGNAPFMKLSHPGIPSTALSREERLDRIPWIAPEYMENHKVVSIAADKWGFGVTLWEICHNGERPLKDKKRIEKERFYTAKGKLVSKQVSQLASLMTECMNYDPRQRPFLRAVLQRLVRIEEEDPAIDSSGMPNVDLDPNVFEKRFLKRIRPLGEGHFGKVELCLYDSRGDRTGELVAVKSLKSESSGVETSNLLREINTMRELLHENIVKYKGVSAEEGGTTFKLIMEYLPMGSLKEYLPHNKPKIDHNKLLLYAKQICEGMEYLGSQNYIHRDLAARNVLVESENLVKIGDFGLTKSIKDNEGYYRVKEEQESPVFWYAPECLVHLKFYRASDVWSFGVTLYEIMTYCDTKKSPPAMFSDMIGRSQGQMTVTRLVSALEAGRRLPCPTGCPEKIYILMKSCWEHSPDHRIDFQGLISEFQKLETSALNPSDPGDNSV
ncbi:tyrosine-protein kinase JAK1-like [Alosa alosa]|nr:tyrosine-protein kinase JAK1-like [Alosa alosa]XP_048097875.1 tyrosine-protein kinase JAK1-like [Alosa alosa]